MHLTLGHNFLLTNKVELNPIILPYMGLSWASVLFSLGLTPWNVNESKSNRLSGEQMYMDLD
jgi:hypothetical protein